MCTCAQVHGYMSAYVYIHVVHVHIYIYVYICTYVCLCMHMFDTLNIDSPRGMAHGHLRRGAGASGRCDVSTSDAADAAPS